MKLKLVVASMSVLGLISCQAFAAATATTDQPKHKHHHHVKKHHHAVEVAAAPAAYKDMGAMPEVCPINDPYTNMMDSMGQNIGRAKPTEDCHKLLSIAGGINFDAKWGNRSMGYQGENAQRVSLNDAYINLYGNVNDWAKAFASISYNDASPQYNGDTLVNFARRNGQYSNVYPTGTLNLEQGYLLLSNFDQSPLFLKLGKFFQDNGRYVIHPITRSLTQSLTESLATAAQAGFVTRMGFHGDISAFDNPLRERSSSTLATGVSGHRTTDYVAALGYDALSDQLSWGINASYIYNMVGVNDVAQAVSMVQGVGFNTITGSGTYNDRVSAGALDAYIASGPFSLVGDYVTAFQRFANNDIGNTITAPGTYSSRGAKPTAGNLQAGYGFNAWGKNQNAYLGYQVTSDAAALFLPKNRWVVGYNVDMWKNTNLGLELDHDTDYNASHGGTGNSSNLINFRAAVKFG